jgi:hypothetical protein
VNDALHSRPQAREVFGVEHALEHRVLHRRAEILQCLMQARTALP